MIAKRSGFDFDPVILDPARLGVTGLGCFKVRMGTDSWVVVGTVKDAPRPYIGRFKASHPRYGKIWGYFGDMVYADNADGWTHFYLKYVKE